MTYETLLIDVRDGVATVTLNRPEARNALNGTVIRELAAVLARLDEVEQEALEAGIAED